MARPVGGAAGAGCAGFSIVGVLVAVGLVVWLGSTALDGSTGSKAKDGTTTSLPLDPGNLTNADQINGAIDDLSVPGTAPKGQTVAISPAKGITDGQAVKVTATGVPTKVEVTTCLTRELRLPDGLGGCDPATTVAATADPSGRLTVSYPVHRVITTVDGAYDCADHPHGCEVVVHVPGDPATGTPAPLVFATGLPPVDAKAPPH